MDGVGTPVTCAYCEEGNVAVDGWHNYPDDFDDGYRVPCAVNPPQDVFS